MVKLSRWKSVSGALRQERCLQSGRSIPQPAVRHLHDLCADLESHSATTIARAIDGHCRLQRKWHEAPLVDISVESGDLFRRQQLHTSERPSHYGCMFDDCGKQRQRTPAVESCEL